VLALVVEANLPRCMKTTTRPSNRVAPEESGPDDSPGDSVMGLSRWRLFSGMSLAVLLNLLPHWQVLRVLQAANDSNRH
jgi:hypothetical protein